VATLTAVAGKYFLEQMARWPSKRKTPHILLEKKQFLSCVSTGILELKPDAASTLKALTAPSSKRHQAR